MSKHSTLENTCENVAAGGFVNGQTFSILTIIKTLS